MDEFILLYYSQVIPANYYDRIQAETSVYFRYFDNTIHIMFADHSSDPDYWYVVLMIINQSCNLD